MESLVILIIVFVVAARVVGSFYRRDWSQTLRSRRPGHPAVRRRRTRRSTRQQRDDATSTLTASTSRSMRGSRGDTRGRSKGEMVRTLRPRRFGEVRDVDDVDEGVSLEHPGGDKHLEELLAQDDLQHRYDYSTRYRVRTWTLQLDQRSMLDGIIFSQILGPPRSRQGLRTQRIVPTPHQPPPAIENNQEEG